MKKLSLFYSLFIIAISISINSCTKATVSLNNVNVALLTTAQAGAVSAAMAESGGNIYNDGGATVTLRGVCWNIKHNPTTDNNKTQDGAGTGNFVSSLSGLIANTTYYIRAYAINTAGISYGNEVSFRTK